MEQDTQQISQAQEKTKVIRDTIAVSRMMLERLEFFNALLLPYLEIDYSEGTPVVAENAITSGGNILKHRFEKTFPRADWEDIAECWMEHLPEFESAKQKDMDDYRAAVFMDESSWRPKQ